MAEGSGGQTSWYRVVSSGRGTKREVLRSGGGRFDDDPDREPTSYLAHSLKTAWLEVSAHAGEARANMRAFRAWRIVLPEGRHHLSFGAESAGRRLRRGLPGRR